MHGPAFWETKVVSYVILLAESESGRRITLSRQVPEINGLKLPKNSDFGHIHPIMNNKAIFFLKNTQWHLKVLVFILKMNFGFQQYDFFLLRYSISNVESL